MKHLFYFILFQLAVIQSINGQNDPNAPAAVKLKSFGNTQFRAVKTEPTSLPRNWAEGTISGSIRDKNGAPKANILVRCGTQEARTDENGDYRIVKLRAGVHYISTHGPRASGDGASGPSDGLTGGGGGYALPESPEVEINAANQNVVLNFVWQK